MIIGHLGMNIVLTITDIAEDNYSVDTFSWTFLLKQVTWV